MPNIKIGYMDKKVNSTKTTFTGTTLDCKLKEDCSMNAPVFLVKGITKGNFYNYAEFEGRYYWIDDIIYVTNDLQKVVCALDPLATYKAEIKATTGYINFGPESVGPVKKSVIDARLNPDILPYVTNDTVSYFNSLFSETGCVIMRVVAFPTNGSTTDPAGVQTIVGSMSDFHAFLRQYCQDLDADINNLSTSFEKLITKMAGVGNALDSIKSAVWLPFPISAFSGTVYSGNCGGWDITGTWYNVTKSRGVPNEATTTYSISLTTNHQNYPWLLNPAYTVINVSTPFGQTQLSDTSFMYGVGTDLKIRIRFGYNCEGDCFLDFRDADAGTKLAFHKWNCAFNLQDYIYKAQNDLVQGLQGAAQIVKTGLGVYFGGAAATASIGSGLSEMGSNLGSYKMSSAGSKMSMMADTSSLDSLKAIGNGVQGTAASVNCNISNGPMAGIGTGLLSMYTNSSAIQDIVRINVKMYMPKVVYDGKYDDYCNEYGWPVMTYGDLSVNGPYQMNGASIKAKAPAHVLSQINSTINSLVYIED